ncbi:MAG: murein biosynthesis integral membrane protein MurJ [Mycobacteriaceae bacterium]
MNNQPPIKRNLGWRARQQPAPPISPELIPQVGPESSSRIARSAPHSPIKLPWDRELSPSHLDNPDELTLNQTPAVEQQQTVASEVPEQSDASVVATTGSIALATLVSRISGFVQKVLLLAVLAPATASAFTVSNTLPNMIAELVLGATLTAIVIPVLVRAEVEDPDHGEAFIRRLVTIAAVLLTMSTIAALIAAPLLTRLNLDSDGQVNVKLATALAYLLIPQVFFYGFSALFTSILNTRADFRPGAWAPVANNVVAILSLGVFFLVPGEISLNPIKMGEPKLLVLGIGTTLGVIVQTLILVPAIRRHRISIRPLWGLDKRLRQFGGMAVAIIAYVLISQIGLFATNHIVSRVDGGGPAIYSQAWLLLQLPYGVLGVTVLTAVMPRLSRNAAAQDTAAVVEDLSLATRLTMSTLIPIVVLMTVTGPSIGHTLFGFGASESIAERIGLTISFSAFTLIPYSLVLLQLRVFYAREMAWTPTFIIIGITAIKILLSLAAPRLASDNEHVVIWLAVANGLGFVVGAAIGYLLLQQTLGTIQLTKVLKTSTSVLAASILAAVLVLTIDYLLTLNEFATNLGPVGFLLRLVFDSLLMLGITAATLLKTKNPEVLTGFYAVQRLVARLVGRNKEVQVSQQCRNEALVSPKLQLPYPDLEQQSLLTQPTSPPDSNQHRGTRSVNFTEGARVSDETVTGSTQEPSTANPETTISDHDGHMPSTELPSTPAVLGTPFTQRVPPRGPRLVPGAAVAGGRYRLLASHGGTHGLQFWQAKDIKLDREVALTFVDASQDANKNSLAHDEDPQAVLSRTLRLGRINSPGLARVLDVVRGNSGGIVVAEWTPGGSLRDMAATVPAPTGAAQAIRALAAAAEAAHRSGSALSIDHPDRVRISTAGNAVLAFPGTLASANQASDVRGLGAMLYSLITARWPLESTETVDGLVGGLAHAELTGEGTVVEPRNIRPEVPFEISAVAVRALQPENGIRTAATVQHVLDQASVLDQKTDLMPAIRFDDDPTLTTQASGFTNTPTTLNSRITDFRNGENQLRTLAIIAAAIVTAIAVLGLLGWWVGSLFGPGNTSKPLTEQNIGLTTPATSQTSPDTPAGTPIVMKTTAVTVFSPEGDKDNPGSADRAHDGNSATFWETDAYRDPTPFPNFKNGVGLLFTLNSPTQITEISIDSPSIGTTVEIRSASSSNPRSLDDTQVLVEAKKLQPGKTVLPITSVNSTKYFIVWISELGKDGSANKSKISEVTVMGIS